MDIPSATTDPQVTQDLSPGLDQPPIAQNIPGEDPDSLFMQQVRDKAKGKVDKDSNNTPPEPDPTKDPEPDPTKDPEPDPTKDPESPKEGDIDIDPLDASAKKPKKTKAENMKNLRNSLKESNETIDTLTAQLEDSQAKVKTIPDIEALQKTLEEKDGRIEELKKYEDLLGLYQTEGHKEKYYDGFDNLVKEATDIAGQYEVSAEVISEAVNITNRKELNAHLLNHFDQISITDVRPLIIQAQQLLVERGEAEKTPAKSKEQLISMMRDKGVTAKAQSTETITNATSSAWNDIVTLYSNNKGVKVLNKVTGNTDHNSQRDALLTKSGDEFGRAMAALVDNGLSSMPDALAKALAARFQLGEVAAHVITENDAQTVELVQLRKELKKVTGYSRPLNNGSNVTTPGTPSTSEAPKGLHEIAKHSMQSAMDKIAAREEK